LERGILHRRIDNNYYRLSNNGINWLFAILIGMCVCNFLRYIMEGVLFLFEKHEQKKNYKSNSISISVSRKILRIK